MRSKGIQILAVALLMAGSTVAQDYPSRPIRLIVPSTPGGSVDMLARSIGPRLSERWGQQVVIDNRSGAGGVIAAETTAKAPPDGYTLIMATIASMATNVSLARNLPYDPVRDFAPVTLVASQQLVLLANSGFAAKSVNELIQLAKAKPGQIAYASAGNGSGGHLSAELLKLLAGIDLLHVPYKGSAPALVDVISGQVPLTMISVITGLPQVKSGRLRALAVSGAHRSPAMPDVPTMIEAGVRGYESPIWLGIMAPAATPKPVIDRLNSEIEKIIARSDVKKAWNEQGAEPMSMTAAQFEKYLNDDIAKWAKVVKASGARVDQ